MCGQGSPSMVKGVGFRSLSCRGSWVQIPPPAPTNKPLNLENYLLSISTLEKCTIDRRVKALKRLSKCVDLSDSERVVKFLNTSTLSNGSKNIIVQAYRDLQRMYNVPELALAKFHVKQKLPFVPLESEIDTLIHNFRNKTSCYLQLLKETGMRPIEAFSLEWTDLDTVQKTVNVRTAKHGLPRILPISDVFLNRVFRLRNESKFVFASEKESIRFDLSLEHFTRGYLKNRKAVSEKLQNPRLRQISLYTFRHWKATTEYLKTRDIFHVKWLLGHSRIENTMKYVHIANAVSVDQGSFSCKVAHIIEECSQLIETGFEYVTEMDGVKLFRKRK